VVSNNLNDTRWTSLFEHSVLHALEKQIDLSKTHISKSFIERLQERELNHQQVLNDDGCVTREDGSVDHLSTAVYMMNYLQEYVEPQGDLGRFSFAQSYQHRLGVATKDLASYHLKEFCRENAIELKASSPSRVFVSHDNDALNNGLKRDGLYAIKHGRIDWLLQIIWSELMRNPRWMNMSGIMDVNDEYGIKSTFFWLVNNRYEWFEERRLRNADYELSDPRIQRIMQRIQDRGFGQGLHKSVSDLSYKEELAVLPFETMSNRNHYLKLTIPSFFADLEQSGLQLDFSLGFAEESGLRNSYARPFRPFRLDAMKPSSVLYVPLMIMDTTNWSYKKEPLGQFKNRLLDLIESHKTDAVISILWHNKYFTNMKFRGYLDVYKAVLDHCVNNGIQGITEKEILEQYPNRTWE